jgi:predicted nuclease of predicted toxin-antitoxin system
VRFLFDHDVPDELMFVLREAGHEVSLLREVLRKESADEDVLAFAIENQFILISCNRDDLVELGGAREHYGIILLFRRRTRLAEKAALLQLIDNAGEEGLRGNITFA